MRTYSNVLEDLIDLLKDAVSLADEHESVADRLIHLDADALIKLSKDAESSGDESLTKQLTALVMFSDESGKRRRCIVTTPDREGQRGTFNTTARELLGSYCENSAVSFLFVNANRKFIHCYFIIKNESKEVISVSFNETIWNEKDSNMLGSINLITDLSRGLKSLLEYK